MGGGRRRQFGCGGLSLPVPPSGYEVPKEDDRPSVFQNQGVVLSGNRIAPAFIVDSPSLSNRQYPESLSFSVKLGRQAVVVAANSDPGRGLQGPQPLLLEAARTPAPGVVYGWSAGIHEEPGFRMKDPKINRIPGRSNSGSGLDKGARSSQFVRGFCATGLLPCRSYHPDGWCTDNCTPQPQLAL